MLIIDRIEGNKAIVETPEGHVDVALGDIEGKARDGAVLTSPLRYLPHRPES